jgi:hypothetical protein
MTAGHHARREHSAAMSISRPLVHRAKQSPDHCGRSGRLGPNLLTLEVTI